jgi:uncharacterized protein (DUF1697 family)
VGTGGARVRRVAALLRAVNVGGRKLAMADLRRVAAEAGFAEPATLLASGNLLVGTALSGAAAAARLEAAIHRDLGVATDILVRDHAELAAVMAANPFPEQAREAPSRLMAMFLAGEPQAGLETLAAACAAGEEVRPGPGCLYVWYPQGAGVSKLVGALIERRLKVRGTARNWNTVSKLTALLAEAA